MTQVFFAALIAITAISLAIQAYYKNKKSLISILILTIFSLFTLQTPELSIILPLLLIFRKKLNYTDFAALNMLTAITLANYFLTLTTLQLPYLEIAFATVILICILAVIGIFENKIKNYLLISSAIQIIFIILDLSVGQLTEHSAIINTVQIFNYTFAGLLLFLTIGVFIKKKTFIYELEGSVFTDKYNDAFATIACLSLAGLPGFNMFVSEWALFTAGYTVSPIITIFGIIAALLLFIMYYKIVYVLLVGQGKKHKVPKPITITNALLAIIIIILGLIPPIQNYILTKIT